MTIEEDCRLAGRAQPLRLYFRPMNGIYKLRTARGDRHIHDLLDDRFGRAVMELDSRFSVQTPFFIRFASLTFT